MEMTMATPSNVPSALAPKLRPLSPALGAEVLGLDVAQPPSAPLVAALQAALDTFGVLLVRDQHLDPAQHVAFSRALGPLQEVAQKQYQLQGMPFIYVIGNVQEGGHQVGDPSVGRLWHSDQSFLPAPAYGSVLFGVQCPPEGADTLFANMYTAYETLPPDLRDKIRTLHAVHSFREYYELLRHRDPTQPELTEARRNAFPDVLHPLVRRNPRTGRLALFINPGYATGIKELPGKEGAELLASLCAHACRQEFVYAHKWRQGDVLIWDNVAVNHKGTEFDAGRYVRRMHRTTIASTQEAYAATLVN